MKHEPATALPWCISNPDGDNDTQVIQMREANPGAVCMGATEGDADYIVHAANAYPKLIAALRETVRAYDGTGGAKGLLHQQAAEGARYLLRQLGEEK